MESVVISNSEHYQPEASYLYKQARVIGELNMLIHRFQSLPLNRILFSLCHEKRLNSPETMRTHLVVLHVPWGLDLVVINSCHFPLSIATFPTHVLHHFVQFLVFL